MGGGSPPWFIFKLVDALLPKLKRRKEDGVEHAGPGHGHAEAAVHLTLEEVDLDRLHFLSFRVEESVSLVDAFGRVDRICWVSKGPARFPHDYQKRGATPNIQIIDHETIPHRPPATNTGSVLECVESPVNVVRSCLLLSYVMKYRAVPSVSRTARC